MPTKMPPITDRTVDIEITRNAWSAWTEAGKPRQLRRPLTDGERSAVLRRANELAPVMAPYRPTETDRVTLALIEMLSGFRSVRGDEVDAVATADNLRRVLAEYPAWAIENACQEIRRDGVWRDGRFDRQWPPSDPELIDAVRKVARLYGDQYQNAVALLAAEVEA